MDLVNAGRLPSTRQPHCSAIPGGRAAGNLLSIRAFSDGSTLSRFHALHLVVGPRSVSTIARSGIMAPDATAVAAVDGINDRTDDVMTIVSDGAAGTSVRPNSATPPPLRVVDLFLLYHSRAGATTS